MSLKEIWKDKIDGQDDILSKDINDVAHQAIENEKNIANIIKSVNNKLDKTIEASKQYADACKAEAIAHADTAKAEAMAYTDDAKAEARAEAVTYTDEAKAEAIAHTDKLNEEMNKRVENLEYLNLSYTEDSTIAYEKTVPLGVAPYALLKSIGGASKASKNILNPNEITSNTPIIVNEDGSFSVTGTWIDVGYYLPAGTYHFVCEANDIPLFTLDGNTRLKSGDNFTLSNPTQISIGFGEYEEPKTITAKIAIFEGSTEREYEPFYSGFKHAKTERIDIINKNLLPGAVYDINNWKVMPNNAANKYFEFNIETEGIYLISGKVADSIGMYFYLQRSVDGRSYSSTDSALLADGTPTLGYLFANGANIVPKYFEHKKGYKWRLWLANASQELLDKVSELQIERGELGGKQTEYEPYSSYSIEMPEAVKALEGYGREGSYIKFEKEKYTFEVTKDENLEDLAKPIVTDITHLFPKDIDVLKVEGGGTLRFVNEHKMEVPNTIQYVTKKEQKI